MSQDTGEATHRDTDDDIDRHDRFSELLQELRVILPGVQVLFAFLLTVPFNARYVELGSLERWLYLVALLATAVSSAFLIAPSAYLRLIRQHRDPQRMLRTFTRLTLSGVSALGVAITVVVLLVVRFLFGALPGGAAAAAIGLLIGGLWYVLPLSRRARG